MHIVPSSLDQPVVSRRYSNSSNCLSGLKGNLLRRSRVPRGTLSPGDATRGCLADSARARSSSAWISCICCCMSWTVAANWGQVSSLRFGFAAATSCGQNVQELPPSSSDAAGGSKGAGGANPVLNYLSCRTSLRCSAKNAA